MKVLNSFKQYQFQARDTAIYPQHLKVLYPAMGLAGEVGEACNKIKKIYRDDGGQLTDEKRQEIKKELGGVLWYLSNLAFDLDISLEDVASENLVQLADRKKRNTLQGSGDNR
jgi:NTP pyrophosphatase (non-canonical NTP hydrolase)